MGRWDNRLIVPPSDGPMIFFLIDWFFLTQPHLYNIQFNKERPQSVYSNLNPTTLEISNSNSPLLSEFHWCYKDSQEEFFSFILIEFHASKDVA